MLKHIPVSQSWRDVVIQIDTVASLCLNPEYDSDRLAVFQWVSYSVSESMLKNLLVTSRPGFGPANPSNQSSIWYNKNITKQTTRWAIVEWLKDEHKNGIWADVIHSHFTTRQANIRKWLGVLTDYLSE